MKLRLAELIPDTAAEGPGFRTAIWVQGCELRCPGCCNPEMLPKEGGRLVDPGALAEQIIQGQSPRLEGITLLGGEPFSQADACAELAERCARAGLSVMVFSGFTLGHLRRRGAGALRLLACCDLLVDGPYRQDRPERERPWLGSDNQRLHFLSSRYQPEDPRFVEGNCLELRLEGTSLTVNGWPAGCDKLWGEQLWREPLREEPNRGEPLQGDSRWR